MDAGDTTMKIKLIGYWATTAFLAFAVLSGGAAGLAHRRDNVEAWCSLATRCISP